MARLRYEFRIEDTSSSAVGILNDTPIDSPAELPLPGDVMYLDSGYHRVKWRDFVYDSAWTKCTIHIRVETLHEYSEA